MSTDRGERREEPAEEEVMRALDRAAKLEREIVAESRLPLAVAENPMTSSAERVKQILSIVGIASTILLIISLIGY